MYLNRLIFGILFFTSACSSQKEKSAQLEVSQEENAPFKQLHTIRVLTAFSSINQDHNQLKRIIIEACAEAGEVYTPDNTTIIQLEKAQKTPYAILMFTIDKIGNDDKSFPIIQISCKMYEPTKILLNGKEFSSNVWEKNRYIEISPDQNMRMEEIDKEVKSIMEAFAKAYYKVNSQANRPKFYIGNNIE